eukprot:scaffold2578_cov370-Prasinococcus_capsulatus_cf.AAC.7
MTAAAAEGATRACLRPSPRRRLGSPPDVRTLLGNRSVARTTVSPTTQCNEGQAGRCTQGTCDQAVHYMIHKHTNARTLETDSPQASSSFAITRSLAGDRDYSAPTFVTTAYTRVFS